MAGGVATELGGGKFKNGAVTAAFVHLFNSELHPHKMDTNEDLYHEYEFETEICSRSVSSCTPKNVWDAVKDNSVPFQNGQLHDGAINSIPGIGKVVTHVDDANYSLVNETLRGHEFEYGTVERSLVITSETISVRTVGVGINTDSLSWWLNNIAKYYFPVKLDLYVRDKINPIQHEFNP